MPIIAAAPSQVIAGAENGTAFVVNACNEVGLLLIFKVQALCERLSWHPSHCFNCSVQGFYFNRFSWILIAGPYSPPPARRRLQQAAAPVYDLNQSPASRPVGALQDVGGLNLCSSRAKRARAWLLREASTETQQ